MMDKKNSIKVLKRFVNKLKSLFTRGKNSVVSFSKSTFRVIKPLWVYAVYGLMISFVAHYLFGFDFSLVLVISWSILYYFVFDELPRLVQSARYKKE